VNNASRARRTRIGGACVVLSAWCATGAVAQEISQKPKPAPPTLREHLPSGRQIQVQPPQPAPQGQESYVPSRELLDEITIDAALLSCIERLGDPTYGLREQATVELLTGDFDREQVYAAMARLTLTAEQRHRMLTALTDKLLSTPRGAVGISIDLRFQPEKIVVRTLLADLPALRALKVGDHITHLNGQPLPNWKTFVEHVQTSTPGTKITVTVERVVSGRRLDRRQLGVQQARFKTIEIEMQLGSAEMLRDPVTGRVQRSGEVYLRLKAEAEDAARTFGPRPRHLQVGQ